MSLFSWVPNNSTPVWLGQQIPPGTFDTRKIEGLIFRTQVHQVIELTNPIARAIVCLESPHITPADVLLFVAAALIMYEGVIKGLHSDVSLQPNSLMPPIDDIIRILVRRFKEIIDSKNGHDAYYTALMLHPGML